MMSSSPCQQGHPDAAVPQTENSRQYCLKATADVVAARAWHEQDFSPAAPCSVAGRPWQAHTLLGCTRKSSGASRWTCLQCSELRPARPWPGSCSSTCTGGLGSSRGVAQATARSSRDCWSATGAVMQMMSLERPSGGSLMISEWMQ
jgi:hypothetical protein